MKIELWSIGKANEKMYAEAIDTFIKRLKNYTKFELVIIASKANTKSSIDEQVNAEAKQINELLQQCDFLVVLDERGEMLNTVKFAKKIEQWQVQSPKRIIFLIGGAFGIGKSVKEKANFQLGLSNFTFPHQLVRLIFVEQLYRAYTVIKGEQYHHI